MGSGSRHPRPTRRSTRGKLRPSRESARPGCSTRASRRAFGDRWETRLRRYAAAGVAGFRCDAPARVPVGLWRRLTAALPRCRFLAWTPGLPARDLRLLAGAGFAATFDSLAWWDGREGWLAEEAARLAAVAPAIATVEAPFGPRFAAGDDDPGWRSGRARRHLRWRPAPAPGCWCRWASSTARAGRSIRRGTGRGIGRLRARPASTSRTRCAPPMRGSRRSRRGRRAAPALRPRRAGRRAAARGRGGCAAGEGRQARAGQPRRRARGLGADGGAAAGRRRLRPLPPRAAGDRARSLAPGGEVRLDPGEARLFEAEAPRPVLRRAEGPTRSVGEPAGEDAAALAARSPRIGIEAVSPAVDGGPLPGEARGGRDGRGRGRPDLRRPRQARRRAAVARGGRGGVAGDAAGRRSATTAGRASFPLSRMGRYVFAVEAWRDAFATFRDELEKKHAAGVPIALELEEGRLLVAAAAERAGAGGELSIGRVARLKNAVERGAADAADGARDGGADGRGRRPAVPRAQPRDAGGRGADRRALRLLVRAVPAQPERRPRAARHLPRRDRAGCRASRAMGFDVLYFPPIHPIGTAYRKGRNNTLTPGPDDPGSPYAIGARRAGTTRIASGTRHPRGLPRAARGGGGARAGAGARLRHPVQPGPSLADASTRTGSTGGRTARSATPRTRRRSTRTSSTSISTPRARCRRSGWRCATWCASGCEQGVRLFRVDNPHTKPFPFWEWLIADIRAPLPGRGVPGGGLHPAQGDVPAGEGRLLAVLHLLHLAEREGGDPGVPDGAGDDGAARLLPPAFLRQHAGHQPGLPADLAAAPAS